MLSQLGTLDYVVMIILLLIMFGGSFLPGLHKKKSAEQFFMAGRNLRWWSVAGSIYGTNINLNQIIGTLGIGYSIGFAQSHFEVLAIPAILLLVYVFEPIYRKRNIYTLSQFLEYRYNEYARLIYMLLIVGIIIVLLVGGFYIGSRQLGLIFSGISYLNGIIILASITCIFLFFGGMESVVIAENIQTILMVLAVVTVSLAAFAQPEINGFTGLLKLDHAQPAALQKMHLYLPPNHPKLPWTGVFSGLMVLQCFFWTTNQFEVQRIMAAATNRDAKLGALAAGVLKISIPFTTIAAGVAAAYIFKHRYGWVDIQPDDAFLKLMTEVVPDGWGLKGLILAGFTAAIFSSIYSMLNSASTMLSMDLYKRYLHKTANDKQVVRFGKLVVIAVCVTAALLAYCTYTPRYAGNSFLALSENTSYLKPGIVTIFFLGVFWRKAHPKAAIITLLVSPFLSIGTEWIYNRYLGNEIFGMKMNFFHRVFISTILCVILMTLLSKYFGKKQQVFNVVDVDNDYRPLLQRIGIFTLLQLPLLFLAIAHIAPLNIIAVIAAIITFGCFIKYKNGISLVNVENGFAGIVAAFTVWLLYFFA
ncbi:solute:Na+ symporter, SSS family [Chitinophaga sp. YR573]|uniref:SLC5 family protein n=1 Tax=Chitinophaga sp. YR573 TaxID=1881040 RepID=UPI0008C276CE|nr:sodium/solute symporter [Chitinophaga sp. YR573]SEW39943.1 solute:Na+ symporter, SSS family [Chitinophaga sp. YR573]